MYRYLAIANYEDRFVIPSSHRELAEAFPERNGCGFSFGDGCHGSESKFNLFNSHRIDAIDITSKTPQMKRRSEGENMMISLKVISLLLDYPSESLGTS